MWQWSGGYSWLWHAAAEECGMLLLLLLLWTASDSATVVLPLLLLLWSALSVVLCFGVWRL